jgi:hypothetical protein
MRRTQEMPEYREARNGAGFTGLFAVLRESFPV